MKEKIKNLLEKEITCSAHRLDHSLRVYNLCLNLTKGENIDMEVLEAAALLHDIGGAKETADPSGKTDHAVIGAKMVKPILKKSGFSKEKTKHVQDCIETHRYKTRRKPKTKEAQILFDADKLDALGAIGIARGFVWIGKNNANIYKKADIKKYAKENLCGKINGRIQDKTKHSPQIEFQTKLKNLPKRLYTKKAKLVAKERLRFHKEFLERMEKEIKGSL